MFNLPISKTVSQVPLSGSQNLAQETGEPAHQQEASTPEATSPLEDSPPFHGLASQGAATGDHEGIQDGSLFGLDHLSEEEPLETQTKDEYYNDLLQQMIGSINYK